MSDPDSIPPLPPETAPLDVATAHALDEEAADTEKSAAIHQGIWLFSLMVLAIGSLAFFYIAPSVNHLNTPSGSLSGYQTLQTEIDNIDKRLQTLESRVQTLKDSQALTLPLAPATPVREEPQIDTATATRITEMHGDMAALSSALAALQKEMKASTETRETAGTLIASLAAYIQLRDRAGTGGAFTNELLAMREAARDDTDVLGAAAELKPYAENGAATLTALHDELVAREPGIEAELAKSTATNWRGRMAAALQHLITVRPLHGETSDALARLETNLKKGNADTAMESFRQLPAGLQKYLADWQKQLEARQHVDESLHAIAAHFIPHPAATSP